MRKQSTKPSHSLIADEVNIPINIVIISTETAFERRLNIIQTSFKRR